MRSASISGFAQLARSLDLDAAALARQAGVPAPALASPDVPVRARAAFRLMELAADAAGVADFGLRLARRRGLSHLGPLGLLAREEVDVRSALRRIIGGMHLHSTCVVLELREQAPHAILQLRLLPDGERVVRQSTEAAVALLFQIVRALAGEAWRPSRVEFVHACAGSDRPHRSLFGCPVGFSREANAVVLRSADLDRPVPGADPGFLRYAAAARLPLVGTRATAASVRQAIVRLLPSGRCSSRAVAQALGMDRRTVHRHLGGAGSLYLRELQAVRAELALQYLDGGALDATAIASLLGFSSLSAFSRWFTTRFGMPPSRWGRDQARANEVDRPR